MAKQDGHQSWTRHRVSGAAELFWTQAKRNAVNNAERGIKFNPYHQISLGNPIALSTTRIVNAQAVAGAGNVATLANTTTGATTGRNLQYVSSNAGDTTQVVIVTGLDMYGETLTEKVTMNGTTVVTGKKAFVSVSTVNVSAAMAGNLSVGTKDALGLPICAAGLYDFLKAWMDTTDELATGTLTVADTTNPATNVTGDVRGTWLPATATNGTHVYRLVYKVPDPTLVSSDANESLRIYGVAQA